MPKQHKYLLLIYKYRGRIHIAIAASHRGEPYGYEAEPGDVILLKTRRYTNYIITHLNKQWINQIQIHRPNKIINCELPIIATEYTPYQYFVNKIRRFFHLHEKY